MRKLIAALNMTFDGYCDHTAMKGPDEEIHDHYTALLKTGDAILYGRKTFQLMEFWPTLLEKPGEDKAMNDFAVAIDQIEKIVFSHTLQKLQWKTARLATRSLEEEVLELKKQPGKDIFVGSPSMIIQTLALGLVDEIQMIVIPSIIGQGLTLFKNIPQRIDMDLIKTKTFRSGAVLFFYEVIK